MSFLESNAFHSSAVCDEPKIQLCHITTDGEGGQMVQNCDHGDMMIRGLWKKSTDCILDIRVTNLEAASHRRRDPRKVLEQQECEKKKKYIVKET